MYTNTHTKIHAGSPSDCFLSSSLNSSSFAYKLLALEHQAWHPSRVHWPADSREMIDKQDQVMEVPLRHFLCCSKISTGTGTPQEHTTLTQDFGSFSGAICFTQDPSKKEFEAFQWRQLVVQGFFKESKLERWGLRSKLVLMVHSKPSNIMSTYTDFERTLCTSAWKVSESHIEPVVLCAILF